MGSADSGPSPSTPWCVLAVCAHVIILIQVLVLVLVPLPVRPLHPCHPSFPSPRGAHGCPHTSPGPSPVLGLVNFLATALAGMEAEGRQLLWGPLIIPLRQAALITSGKKFIRAAALTTFICAAGSDSLGSQIKAMMGPDEIHCLFILCDLIHLPIHHLPCGIPPYPALAPPFPSQPCPKPPGALPGPSSDPRRPLACPHTLPVASGLESGLRAMTMPPGAMWGQLWNQNHAIPCELEGTHKDHQHPGSGATQPRAASHGPCSACEGCSPSGLPEPWPGPAGSGTAVGTQPCGDRPCALLLPTYCKQVLGIPLMPLCWHPGAGNATRSPQALTPSQGASTQQWARPHQQHHSCPVLPCPSPALPQYWSTSGCQGDQCGFTWPQARTG